MSIVAANASEQPTYPLTCQQARHLLLQTKTMSANRAARCCESANLSQPTGRRESANQPGRRDSDNQVASQTARSRVSQPVASQPTGHESANRSRVSQQVTSQPTGHVSGNPVASQPTSLHAGHEKKGNEMRGGRERT